MTSDVTAGYFVSELERLRAPMEKISELILEKVLDDRRADLMTFSGD